MTRISIFLLFLFVGSNVFAQTRQLNGQVTDATNKPIIAVTVKVKGGTTTTVTNADGRFSFNVPAGNVILVLSSVGFNTNEVKVAAGENNLTIALNVSNTELAEVVVTALGIRKERKALGYALSEIKGDELTQARSNSIVNNLVGKVAGLNVASTATGAG
ncbi:carboxypeptidase-like regulatory domain-containing protein, partial [Ferruginibacter sp.]